MIVNCWLAVLALMCVYQAVMLLIERRQKRQYIKWTPKLDNLLLELQKDGKTSREIAELMGTTRESVRQRMNRLREKAETACNTGSCKR